MYKITLALSVIIMVGTIAAAYAEKAPAVPANPAITVIDGAKGAAVGAIAAGDNVPPPALPDRIGAKDPVPSVTATAR